MASPPSNRRAISGRNRRTLNSYEHADIEITPPRNIGGVL